MHEPASQPEPEPIRQDIPSFSTAPLTYCLSAICVVVFLLQMAGGKDGKLDYPELLTMTGWQVMNGQYWGLLTSCFVHGGILHVAFNVCWLWRFGTALEPYIGAVRFAVFWILATVMGGLVQINLSGETGIGASGFVYALFGLIWIGGRTEPYLREIVGPEIVALFLFWFVLCVYLTWTNIMPVANGAHAGGLAFGAACGYAFINRQDEWAGAIRGAVLGAALLALLTVFYSPWSSAWNLGRAIRYIHQDNTTEALASLDRVDLPGYDRYVLFWRAELNTEKKNWSEAVANWQALLDIPEDSLPVSAYNLNACAWLLATCPDAKIRNPAKALRLAQQACDKTRYQDAGLLDTLAAAYAANGEFDKAVEWQRKALAALEARPRPAILKELQDRLSLYQAKKAYIEE